MEYRRMGNTGLVLSAISLGTWATIGQSLDYSCSRELIKNAYDQGINLFDTAEVYASGEAEKYLGDIIRDLGFLRESFVVCTKVMWGANGRIPNSWGLSRKHVFEGVNSCLRRLKLDHVDILLCHRPDPKTPLEETVIAMGDLVRLGKILYWGTSEWDPQLITAARAIAKSAGAALPVVEQSRYNLFHRRRVEVELLPFTRDNELGICVWSPLAYGLLAGRYRVTDRSQARLNKAEFAWLKEEALGNGRENGRIAAVDALAALAESLGTTAAPLALAWCLMQPAVSSVVMGASSSEQLSSNLHACNIMPLPSEVMAVLDEIFGSTRD